jgi:hypothetical protein
MAKRITTSRGKTEVGKHWKSTDKIKAVASYLVLGDASKVEEVTGIPAGTIRYWKTQPWWFELVQKVAREQDEKIKSRFTHIINKTQDVILDRIDNGETILTKDGRLIQKPISAKDAAIIASIAVEKRKIIQDSERQLSDDLSTKERLEKLSEEFKSFIKAKTIKGEATIVEEVGGEAQLQEGIRSGIEGAQGREGATESSPSGNDEPRTGKGGGWEGRGAQASDIEGGREQPVESGDAEPVGKSFFQAQL